MTICKKCGKDIANDFAFCPFCGAKVFRRKEKADYNNFDWAISTASGMEAFKKEFVNGLAKAGPDAVINFLCDHPTTVPFYQIKAAIRETDGNYYKTRKYQANEKEINYWLKSSRENVAVEGDWWCEILYLYIYEKTLQKADLYKMHEKGFLTREECLAQMKALGDKYGIRVVNYEKEET